MNLQTINFHVQLFGAEFPERMSFPITPSHSPNQKKKKRYSLPNVKLYYDKMLRGANLLDTRDSN